MLDYIMDNMRNMNDMAMKEAIDSGRVLRIKNEEEGFGHLTRWMCAVRSCAKELEKQMDKAAAAMLTKEDFEEKANVMYGYAQSLAAAAMQLSLGARQIYEQNVIWPGARAGMTPMEALAEDAQDDRE